MTAVPGASVGRNPLPSFVRSPLCGTPPAEVGRGWRRVSCTRFNSII
jgi:hypothetical protein